MDKFLKQLQIIRTAWRDTKPTTEEGKAQRAMMLTILGEYIQERQADIAFIEQMSVDAVKNERET